jgi:glucan phosphoethanolaminetransferase (alkaline phosphatase superfamily)
LISSRLKKKESLALIVFIAALLGPNLYCIHIGLTAAALLGNISQVWTGLQFILFNLVTILFFFWLLPLRAFIYMMLAIGALIPLAFLHLDVLRTPITTGMIANSFAATGSEIAEALSTGATATTAGMALFLLMVIAAALLLKSPRLKIPFATRSRVFFSLLALYLAASFPIDAAVANTTIFKEPVLMLRMMAGFARPVGGIGNSFPVGAVGRTLRVGQDLFHLLWVQKQKSDRPIKLTKDADASDGKPKIHVLVLGESARRDHFELFGYPRATNPELSKRDDLLTLHNVVSLANNTVSALTLLMTRGEMNRLDSAAVTPTLIDVAKAAGYDTYWIANMKEHGSFASKLSLLASSADHVKYLTVTETSSSDDRLIDELKSVLDQGPERSKFIVLHQMGSHFPYCDKFPEEFNRFLPSCLGQKLYNWMQLKNKDLLINSYDNSILFTDHVLSELIKTVEAKAEMATLTFLSDHGQNLMDRGETHVLHSSAEGYRSEYEVPFIMWTSREFSKLHSSELRNFARFRHVPLTSSFFYDTLVHGIMGISLEEMPATLDLFTLQAAPKRPRLVLTGASTLKDFDRL